MYIFQRGTQSVRLPEEFGGVAGFYTSDSQGLAKAHTISSKEVFSINLRFFLLGLALTRNKNRNSILRRLRDEFGAMSNAISYVHQLLIRLSLWNHNKIITVVPASEAQVGAPAPESAADRMTPANRSGTWAAACANLSLAAMVFATVFHPFFVGALVSASTSPVQLAVQGSFSVVSIVTFCWLSAREIYPGESCGRNAAWVTILLLVTATEVYACATAIGRFSVAPASMISVVDKNGNPIFDPEGAASNAAKSVFYLFMYNVLGYRLKAPAPTRFRYALLIFIIIMGINDLLPSLTGKLRIPPIVYVISNCLFGASAIAMAIVVKCDVPPRPSRSVAPAVVDGDLHHEIGIDKSGDDGSRSPEADLESSLVDATVVASNASGIPMPARPRACEGAEIDGSEVDGQPEPTIEIENSGFYLCAFLIVSFGFPHVCGRLIAIFKESSSFMQTAALQAFIMLASVCAVPLASRASTKQTYERLLGRCLTQLETFQARTTP